MARHEEIVVEIQQMIRARRLRPGDVLPSDRELAKRFSVAHSTVRYANDLLCRQGLLRRQHGRGTFLAEMKPESPSRIRQYRLGLLYVDMDRPINPYSQELTFGIQRAALQGGYQLFVEEMHTDDLVRGKIPEMIRRRSVDAVLLDGRVREHHIRFLESQEVLYLVTGNTPLGKNVPQVRVDLEGLMYHMTRELLQAGRHPVWLDSPPQELEPWHPGVEVVRGYARAIKQHAPSAALHFCGIEPNRVGEAADMLSRAGLQNSAFIANSWPAALLPAALALRNPQATDLLILPSPRTDMQHALHGPNVVRWTRLVETAEIAEQALNCLLPVLEGKTGRLRSRTWNLSCRWAGGDSRSMQMELVAEWKSGEAFTYDEYPNGRVWQHVPTEQWNVEEGAEKPACAVTST